MFKNDGTDQRADSPENVRDALLGLASYALSCQRLNTDEWMEGLVDALNAAAEALGDRDRFLFNHHGLIVRRR